MAGQIVHLEIPADDTGKALKFWSGLFGWQFEAFPGSPAEYHMTRLGETQGAAVTNMEQGKRAMRPYFDVDDVNAAAARVRELGGEADERMPVPGMGWFVTCRDPQGSDFGLWQTDSSAA
jgi:predicted enzyme related to lactoylglutathione lyase